MTSCRAKNGSVNGKFVQQGDCELAVEHYREPHLKLLQYDSISTSLTAYVTTK